MNKKEILKQLENIKDLMDCNVFHVDEELDKDNLLSNDKMYKGITKAIKLIKNTIYLDEIRFYK